MYIIVSQGQGGSPPGLVIACLVVMTLLWPLAAMQGAKLWRHSTEFFDAPSGSYRRARIRSFPVFICVGLLILASVWCLVLDQGRPPASPDAIRRVALSGFLAATFLGLVVGPSIVLFNRPRCAVPPHLRQDAGHLAERRRRSTRLGG